MKNLVFTTKAHRIYIFYEGQHIAEYPSGTGTLRMPQHPKDSYLYYGGNHWRQFTSIWGESHAVALKYIPKELKAMALLLGAD